MSVSPTSAATAVTGVAAETKSNTSDAAIADYDDFLTLLTTQLRNQDPLNPQDGTEFVEQIATFTTVEQQINTVDRLDQLIALENGGALEALGAWVDKTVSAGSSGFLLSGSTVAIETPADAAADEAAVVIRDAGGAEIAVLAASPSGGTVSWDGRRADGTAAAAGYYTAEFRFGSGSGTADQKSWTTPKTADGRVVEARQEGETTVLVLDNGSAVTPDAITSVRADD